MTFDWRGRQVARDVEFLTEVVELVNAQLASDGDDRHFYDLTADDQLIAVLLDRDRAKIVERLLSP